MVKAYLVQTQPVPGDKERSLKRAENLILNATPEPGSLVILPEMFATGFLENPEESLAEVPENAHSETRTVLQRIADKTRCLVLGGGIEKFQAGKFSFRNWTGLFSPGKNSPVAIYRKRHPFAGEAQSFSPGTELSHFEWNGLCVFPFICFDLRFPEDFRRARLQGASLFTVQAEWPKCREEHFSILLQARAIENQAFVLAAARAGEPFAPSRAMDPTGKQILLATSEEKVFEVPIDPRAVSAARESFPLPPPSMDA